MTVESDLRQAQTLLGRGRGVATSTESIIIDRPCQEIFDYVADARHQHEWNTAVKDMRQTTPDPIGVGTQWVGRIKRVGELSVEIIGFEPPKLIIHRARPTLAEVVHVWRFSPADAGTRLDQAAAMRPRGWGWLMAPLMPFIVKQNTHECAVSLKAALKAGR
jgi:hypothetical protein